jgi:hypothetical protein
VIDPLRLVRIRVIIDTSHPLVCRKKRLHGGPVRIRVRIYSKHPLVCRNRRLNGSGPSDETEKKPRSGVTSGVAKEQLIDYLLLYVPLKNFSLIWRRYHCRWRAVKFRPMVGAQGLWAGRDLYRATPTVTRNFGFSNWKSKLVRYAITVPKKGVKSVEGQSYMPSCLVREVLR